MEWGENTEQTVSFLANLSHELRTPLHALCGILDVMKNMRKDQIDEIQQYCEIGRRTCEDMSTTLDNCLFQLKKYECEGKDHDLHSKMVVTLQDVFDSTAIGLNILATRHKIIFEMSYSCDSRRLFRVDVQKTKHIFNNICGNAIKFTKTEVKVGVDVLQTEHMVTDIWEALSSNYDVRHINNRVSDHKGEYWLVIWVKDNGCGIPREDLPTIFEKYKQLNDGNIKGFSSSGLGLYNTQNDIKSMKGFLAVASLLSEGTLLFCGIPIVCRNFNEDVVFLVVDDSKVNVMVAKKQVERNFQNATVYTASNGELALREIERLLSLDVKIDGVLLDYHMPVMSGPEATQKIKREISNNIPVTMLTGDITETSKKSMMECGVDFVLLKPSNPDELVDACDKMVELRKQRLTSLDAQDVC